LNLKTKLESSTLGKFDARFVRSASKANAAGHVRSGFARQPCPDALCENEARAIIGII